MEKEDVYQLTLKGLLSITIKDERILKETMDNLELYLRRNFAKNGYPAIVFDVEENNFHFVTLNKKQNEK